MSLVGVADVGPAEATGVASQLVVTTQPSTTATSGEPLSTQPVVTIEDSSGSVVTSSTGTVTATITAGTGTISAGATATIANGVATFGGLTITGATGTDTLAFVDGTLGTAVSWTGTTIPTGGWYSVAYGNGVFVAVSRLDSAVAYSTDGSNWTSLDALPSSQNWSVTYGNRLFVAVAEGSNEAAYSTNGSTWTSTTLPGSENWQSVTYGNGMFVAVAVGSADDAYSVDGSSWTGGSLPVSGEWQAVTYANGLFVAVAGNSTEAAYSTNGTTWTNATLPASADWWAVTYGNGLFVAVAYNSDDSAYSTDGSTWTIGTMPSSTNWYSIAYANGVFIAISDNSTAASSTNGSVWTGVGLPNSADWASVAYGNGVFVAVAHNSNGAAAATSITAAPAAAINLSATSGGGSGSSGGGSTPANQLQINAPSLSEPFGASWSPTVTVTGLRNGDSAAVTGTVFTYSGTGSTVYPASTTEPTGPGTYLITPSLSTVTIAPNFDATNYAAAIEFVPGTLVITRSSPTVIPHPVIASTATFVHHLVFNTVLHGQTLQGARSVTLAGGTARILSRSELRLVVRISLTKQARAGNHLAVVHFTQGPTAQFFVSVNRLGSSVTIRTSTRP